jgi:phospholipase C
LEERFGVRAPNISEWRRQAAGDLTSTLHMHTSDRSMPTLPSTSDDQPANVMAEGCNGDDILEVRDNQPAYPVPMTQSMPRQETA